MRNSNQKYLIAAITLFSILIIAYDDSRATVDQVLGKVVYSDNNAPVTSGLIRVYNSSGTESENVIATASISTSGEFIISNNVTLTTDDIKIMAYPNDLLDNGAFTFEPNIVDMQAALSNHEERYAIVIKVNRTEADVAHKSRFGGIYLKQNYPNPFNPTTSITFDLPNSSKVTMKIYNMRGETVATLIDNKTMSKGSNEVEFNAGNLTSGIYIYSLKAGEFTLNRKMILLK